VHDDTAFFGYSVHRPDTQLIDQISDAAIAVGFNVMSELAGMLPDEVRLSRRAPGNCRPYQRFFGCSVQFDAEQNALVFPAKMLACPVRGAVGELRRILEKSVAQYWAVKQPSITGRLARILCARATFDGESLEDIAQRLAIHPRTLNRCRRRDQASVRC
jgi:hypothetical protein